MCRLGELSRKCNLWSSHSGSHWISYLLQQWGCPDPLYSGVYNSGCCCWILSINASHSYRLPAPGSTFTPSAAYSCHSQPTKEHTVCCWQRPHSSEQLWQWGAASVQHGVVPTWPSCAATFENVYVFVQHHQHVGKCYAKIKVWGRSIKASLGTSNRQPKCNLSKQLKIRMVWTMWEWATFYCEIIFLRNTKFRI